jgi:hypothetical protein
MKAQLKSKIVLGVEEVNLTDILSIAVSNLKPVATTFKLNGIERSLPAFDVVNQVPVGSFVITSVDFAFDIALDFNKPTTKIVIDYLKVVNPPKPC